MGDDLRELVARALFANRPHNNPSGAPEWGRQPDSIKAVFYRDTDAVLSAIGERHAIVERVGEDVIREATRQADEIIRARAFAEHGTDIGVSAGDIETAVKVASPIIAAHARDAALEEAAIRAEKWAEEHKYDRAEAAGAIDVAEAIRALKSGGRHG